MRKSAPRHTIAEQGYSPLVHRGELCLLPHIATDNPFGFVNN